MKKDERERPKRKKKGEQKKPSRPAARAAAGVRPRNRAVPPRSTSTVPPPGDPIEPDQLEAFADADVPPADFEAGPSVDGEDRLSELQRDLDRLLAEAVADGADPVARRRAARALEEIASRLAPDERPAPDADERGARELLSTDYYVRVWGRAGMRNRSEEVDDFGLDPAYEARVAPLLEAIYRRWFRVKVEGIANVPNEGRALLVGNHGGAIPWDGIVLKMAMRLEHPRNDFRWLAEDFVFHMPFVGAILNRLGAVRACQENAERLLADGRLVAVFPEGEKGIGKTIRNRYRLQRFGRGGYVKLALRTGTPIVPVAIVGSEEAMPLLFRLGGVKRWLGVPFLPITPTFPWLGPAGLLPLPARFRILFGEPIAMDGHGADAANDALVVNRINESVRAEVRRLLDRALSERGSVFG